MSKNFKRRIGLGGATFLVLALFGFARNAASWRATQIGIAPFGVQYFAVSPDGKLLAISNGGYLGIWDTQTGKQAFSRQFGNEPSIALRFVGDKRLFVAYERKKIRSDDDWHWTLGVKEILLSRGSVRQLALTTTINDRPPIPFPLVLSRDGQTLRWLGTLKWRDWNLKSGKITRVLGANFPRGVEAFSRDGKRFFGFDWDGKLYEGDVSSGKIVRSVNLQKGEHIFESVQFSPFGALALLDSSSANSSGWRVFDPKNGRKLWNFPSPGVGSPNWIFTPNEREIWIEDGKWWQVREARSGKVLRRIGRVANCRNAYFSDDGAMLFCVDGRNRIFRQRAR